MGWTLWRYVARRFFGAVLGVAAIVATMAALGALAELLRRSGGGEPGVLVLLGMSLLAAPQIAMTALPFIVLLAALAAFARLSRGSEIVVTRAAGVSVWALTAPGAAVAAAVGVAGFAALNPLVAASTLRYETLEARHLSGRASLLSVSREGLWLRQPETEGGQTVIRARAASADASELRGVTFFVSDRADETTGRIDAASAMLRPGAWVLFDAIERRFADEAATVDTRRHARLELPTALTSAQILDSFAPPETMSFWSLPGFIAALEAAGFSSARHRTHWHGQLAQPVLFAAMALIGAAFAMRHHRFGGLGAMAFGAVLTGFGFYVIADVAKALGASGAAPAPLAAWAPPLAALCVAAGLLLQREEN
ncbi:MAG: LPS export ABC transporter permease LptG [Rhodobacteraceae bacterium]|nr:MAG: LPS export ABC transporter permease LptG [Paracoccaceae bacterium]